MILNLKFFVEKNKLKDNNLSEIDLTKVYNFPIYPRNNRILTAKVFVDISNGFIGRTHWTPLNMKDKSFYFESFGVIKHDEVSLQQLPKPITFHNYKNQDKMVEYAEHVFNSISIS